MNIKLSAIEARIIGVLIEKQITTPDQYPLSLNALVNACNQKSNRDPLMQETEQIIKTVVDGLQRRHFVVERSGFGSRVPKYQQAFCNTEFGSLRFTPLETAIVCELLLRGPQTPGELRARVTRMAELQDPNVVEKSLETLAARADGPIVVQLAREAGRRDSRWAQLFEELPSAVAAASDEEKQSNAVRAASLATSHTELLDRIASLEQEVAQLKAEIVTLRSGSAN